MSVWGCCVGRNIFNAPQLLNSISVKNFIFQITPFSCFDVPLNIPYEEFDLPVFTKFEKECLDFNLNKTCIEKLEKNKTEYITLDFVSSSFEMFRITFNHKTTIARMWEGRRLLNVLSEIEYFKENGFMYEIIDYSCLPSELVYDAQDQLIRWLKINYRPKQIIICIPTFPDKWLNKELKVCEYSEKSKLKYKDDEKYVRELTEYTIQQINGCNIYSFPENMIAAEWGGRTEPPPFHYTSMDYLQQGELMCDLLGIDWKESYCMDLPPCSYMMERWCSNYYYSRKKLFDTEAVLLDQPRKDPFIGTSISSVSISSWSKGLNTVNQLKSKVFAAFQEEVLKTASQYISLQKKIVFLEEKLIGANISNEEKVSLIKVLSTIK